MFKLTPSGKEAAKKKNGIQGKEEEIGFLFNLYSNKLVAEL